MKLLAVIIGAESAVACLDAATLAARSLKEASVEALNVVVDPERIIAANEEIDLQLLREHDEGTAQERSDAAHAAFIAWKASVGDDMPEVHWRSIVGAEEETVKTEAAKADALVTIARERTMDSIDALHAAIFTTGKPVLIVPAGWRSGSRTCFRHVAIGLSDSEAARHAIAGAAPWLHAAERVTALRIGAQGDPALGLEAMLEDIGVHPELHVVPRSHDSLGRQLIIEAKAIGADLLVTGAYRHNEILEWLLGGTTRHLLAEADLPLLMAH